MTEKLLLYSRKNSDRKLNYWMPYMDMNEAMRKGLGLSLYLINITLAWFIDNIDVYVSILGSTTMPFISFIIPGALYYQHLKIED
jgi:hypothetical protein